MSADIQVRGYESAYPGSMFPREDGGYVQRDDANSLAAALLALIKSADRTAHDACVRIIELEADAEMYAKKDACIYRLTEAIKEAMSAIDEDEIALANGILTAAVAQ